MNLSATVKRQSRPQRKTPPSDDREDTAGTTGLLNAAKRPGWAYFSLALIETPTMRGSL